MRSYSKLLFGILLLLGVGQGLIQRKTLFPLWSSNYSLKQYGLLKGLSPEHLPAALAGFRELLAGILWIRADTFFHEGNFDAVIPIIRLVSWLDPHNIDVFSVGMWHIGYNFTDQEHRSDRRYIPCALALGEEGARKNPHTYEMFFELGWMWHHKIDDDYSQAVKWMEDANRHEDILFARRSMLSHAYLRNGEPEKALHHYHQLLQKAEKNYSLDPDYGNHQILETIEKNLDFLALRTVNRRYNVYPPYDVGFSTKVSIIEPKILQIEGTWNLDTVGTKIKVILRDKKDPMGRPAGLQWNANKIFQPEPPEDQTYMQDQIHVKNRSFKRRIDMSKDPAIYPFDSNYYLLEFYYNPRSAPSSIQDRLGTNGEGMIDIHFLNKTIRPHQQVIYAVLELTQEQILRKNQWAYQVPVLQTKNFKALSKKSFHTETIQIPSFRNFGR